MDWSLCILMFHFSSLCIWLYCVGKIIVCILNITSVVGALPLSVFNLFSESRKTETSSLFPQKGNTWVWKYFCWKGNTVVEFELHGETNNQHSDKRHCNSWILFMNKNKKLQKHPLYPLTSTVQMQCVSCGDETDHEARRFFASL